MIGAVEITKTTSIKTWFRDAYAEHRGVSPDEVKIVHERVANRDAAEIAGVTLPCKVQRPNAAGAPVLDANGNPRMIMGTQFTKPPVLLSGNASPTVQIPGSCSMRWVRLGQDVREY